MQFDTGILNGITFLIIGNSVRALDIIYLAFRCSIAILFIIHGMPKLRGESRRKERMKMKGLGVPNTFFDVVAVFEFFGGLMLLVGFLTRVVSLLFALLMAMIIYFNITKMSKPPDNKKYVNGWDRDTILLTALLLLVVMGAGIFSIDALIGF